MENEIRPLSDKPYTKKDLEDMMARLDRLAEEEAAEKASESEIADKQRKIG